MYPLDSIKTTLQNYKQSMYIIAILKRMNRSDLITFKMYNIILTKEELCDAIKNEEDLYIYLTNYMSNIINNDTITGYYGEDFIIKICNIKNIPVTLNIINKCIVNNNITLLKYFIKKQ